MKLKDLLTRRSKNYLENVIWLFRNFPKNCKKFLTIEDKVL